MLREHARHRVAIADVGVHERDARIGERPLQVQQAARVRQLVDDDEAILRTIAQVMIEQMVDEVRADEPGAAGNDERHAMDNLQWTIDKAKRDHAKSVTTRRASLALSIVNCQLSIPR